MRALFLATALSLAVVALPAVAGSLEPFAGSFKGAGTARAKPADAAETARCRVTGTLSDDKLTLKQTGQCAIPGHKVDIGGTVKLDAASDRLTGSWRDVATGRNGSLSGRFDGAAMRLTMVVTNPGAGEPSTYFMTVTPSGSGYTMVSRAPGGGEPLASIAFQK